MVASITSLPWYVYLAGVGLLISLIVLLRAVLHKFPGNRPPVYEEIPFIGGVIGFIRSPIQLATRGYKAVGEVSSLSCAHRGFSCIRYMNAHHTTIYPYFDCFSCVSCSYSRCAVGSSPHPSDPVAPTDRHRHAQRYLCSSHATISLQSKRVLVYRCSPCRCYICA
jgi:hypothetical protein